MSKKMNTDAANTVETLETAAATTAAAAELIPLSALPLAGYKTKAGEDRIGIRLHSLKYLPTRVNEEGQEQTARFGGLCPTWTDPATGTVHCSETKNSVPLQFFGSAADQLRSILTESFDPERDAIMLGVNGDPTQLFASVHRNADGSVKQFAVGTREFRGNHKKLIANPKAKVEEE